MTIVSSKHIFFINATTAITFIKYVYDIPTLFQTANFHLFNNDRCYLEMDRLRIRYTGCVRGNETIFKN